VLFISCGTPKAEVRYTTDGSEPTVESPLYSLYSGPVELEESVTISARAFRQGWDPSAVVSAAYEITGQVASPKFSLKPGMYTTEQTVRLDCADSEARIFYTTGRSEPTQDSTPYKDPIQLAESVTLSARAYKTGWVPSEVVSASYEVSRRLPAPVFSIKPGNYDTAQTVAVECDTGGTKIYYTTDGSEPTEESSLYTGPLELSETVTLSVRAYKIGWTPSESAEGVFKIIKKKVKPAVKKPPVEVSPPPRKKAIPKREEVQRAAPSEGEEEVVEEIEVIPERIAGPVKTETKKEAPIAGAPPKAAVSTPQKRKKTVEEDSSVMLVKGLVPDFLYILNEEWFEPGEEIIERKKYGDWFWVVLEGAVDIIRETPRGRAPILRLGTGSYPGVFAAVLSPKRMRTATAVAVGKVCLGVMDIQRISTEFSSLSSEFRVMLESLVARVAQITDLAENFYLEKSPEADDRLKTASPLIKQGEKTSGLFRIKQGNAFLVRHEEQERVCLATLGTDDFFGQIPLLDFGHEPLGASILGSPDVETLEIDQEKIRQEYEKLTKAARSIIANLGDSLSITTKMAFKYRKK